MRFENLLSRVDDVTLQEFLGGHVIRLLTLLDPSLTSPSRLRELLVALHSPADLLVARQYRTALLALLRLPDAKRLADVLEIPAEGDVYVSLQQVSIPRGSVREHRLFDFFELPYPTPIEREQHPTIELASSAYPLFSYQRTAARQIRQLLESEPFRALLHMPTGAGKTRTAMHVVADHLRSKETTLVIWLAYSEELCEQASDEFQEAWRALGDRDIRLHRYWGRHTLDLTDMRDGIMIASLSKVYQAAMANLQVINDLASRCSLVVIDEAHQAIAPTYKLVLDALVVQRRSTALLGLSATPGRTWEDVGADQELAQFFGYHKVTLNIQGYSNPVNYLVDEHYLARAEYRPLFGAWDLHLTDNDIKHIETQLDIPTTIIKKLAEDEQRNLAILSTTERLARHHQRILVFAATVEHANLLASLLRARGLHASSVTGATPPDERSRLIADYKDDAIEPKILCNYGVLTTGFDAPRTSAALIARPTRSLVLYSQMVGRAIRGTRAGGNRTAEIVTVVDPKLRGFGDVADAFTNWEDVWR